jgi:hypothetical protein
LDHGETPADRPFDHSSLLVHMNPISYLAHLAAGMEGSDVDLAGLRFQLAIASEAALLVLLTATTLSIYKPQGMTPYGWRRRRDNIAQPGL